MAGVDVLQDYQRADMDCDEPVQSEQQGQSMSRRTSKRKTASGFDASLIDFQDAFEEDSDSDYAAERTSAKRNIIQKDASQVSSRDEEEYLASILLMIKTCDTLPAVLVTQDLPAERLELVSRVHQSLTNASGVKTPPTKRNKKQHPNDTSDSREERTAKRELSRMTLAQTIGGAGSSRNQGTPSSEGSEMEGPATVSRRGAAASPSVPREKKGKGRRFMRFACDKHRREHVKCPENCPLRKQNREDAQSESSDDSQRGFLNSSESFEDDNHGDDMFC